MAHRSLICVLALFWAASPTCAQQEPPVLQVDEETTSTEPLPEPLTLSDALRFARDDHPELARLAAQRTTAESRVQLASSYNDWRSHIDLDARTVDKVVEPGHNFRDDSRASFYLSRVLTDFGEGEASTLAAKAKLDGADLMLAYTEVQHRIEIMRRFLDVQLADLRYFVDDEDMTLAFLRYDRVRERRERFQEFAQVQEKELEATFRERLSARTRASNRQRNARNQLALSMGRPGELANTVIDPDLSIYDRDVPEYDELLEQVLAAHPLMKVNSLLLDAADQTIRSLEISQRPELLAQFEATKWSLEVGNRDQYLAGILLQIPLGGKAARNAKIAEAVAERQRLEADRRALEFELRQKVLDLVQQLGELNFEAEAARVNEEYRDLSLDRARSLYQLEVRSDLGDSQARQAEAVWRSRKVEFERALTWAQVDAMRNMPLAVERREGPQ